MKSKGQAPPVPEKASPSSHGEMLTSLIRNQQTKFPPFEQINAEKDCWNMPLHESDKLFDRISEASLNISLT